MHSCNPTARVLEGCAASGVQLATVQQDYLSTAKDATTAVTRLEMFSKDMQQAQDTARQATADAAEAKAKLVCARLALC